jgi:hypothetical protein
VQFVTYPEIAGNIHHFKEKQGICRETSIGQHLVSNSTACVKKCDTDTRCNAVVFQNGVDVKNTQFNCKLKEAKCKDVDPSENFVTLIKEKDIPCDVYENTRKKPILQMVYEEEPEGFRDI